MNVCFPVCPVGNGVYKFGVGETEGTRNTDPQVTGFWKQKSSTQGEHKKYALVRVLQRNAMCVHMCIVLRDLF